MAIISAWAVGIAKLLALVVRRTDHAAGAVRGVVMNDDGSDRYFSCLKRPLRLAQRQTHEILVRSGSGSTEFPASIHVIERIGSITSPHSHHNRQRWKALPTHLATGLAPRAIAVPAGFRRAFGRVRPAPTGKYD